MLRTARRASCSGGAARSAGNLTFYSNLTRFAHSSAVIYGRRLLIQPLFRPVPHVNDLDDRRVTRPGPCRLVDGCWRPSPFNGVINRSRVVRNSWSQGRAATDALMTVTIASWIACIVRPNRLTLRGDYAKVIAMRHWTVPPCSHLELITAAGLKIKGRRSLHAV